MNISHSNFIKIALHFFLPIILFTVEHPLRARDIRGDTGNFPLYGKFTIAIPKTTFAIAEDIFIECSISNTGSQKVSLQLFPLAENAIQFHLIDNTGQKISAMQPFLYSKTTLEKEYQTIEIAGGDKFVKKIRLNDYYNLQPQKKYTLQAIFYPYAFSKQKVYSQNQVDFYTTKNRTDFLIDESQTEFYELVGQPNATEIVENYLRAKTSGNKMSILKYLDLPSFISSYPQFDSQYQQAQYSNDPQNKKLTILKEFANYLTEEGNNYIEQYHIKNSQMKDSITNESSLLPEVNVIVEAVIRKNKARNRYLYTYTVQQKNTLWGKYAEWEWKIISVSASYLSSL